MKSKLLFSLIFIFSLFPLFSLEILRPLESLEEEYFCLKDPSAPFQIIFGGQNWIFYGADTAVLYLSDVILKSEVRFNFKLSSLAKEGKIPLKFFYQDLAKGKVFLKTVWIDISDNTVGYHDKEVNEKEEGITLPKTLKESSSSFNKSFINWLDPSSFSQLSEEAIMKGRDQLIAWQDFEGALSLTKEIEKRGKDVSQELGDLYYLKGDNKSAYQMYRRALKNSPTEENLTLTTLLSMLLEEKSSLLDFLRYWITGFPPPEERVYLMVLNYLISHQDWEISFKWLNQYFYFYKSPKIKDYYYYLVGNFFESASPYQDIYLSYEYYDKLIKEYPLSLYWENAYDRMLTIKSFYLRE